MSHDNICTGCCRYSISPLTPWYRGRREDWLCNSCRTSWSDAAAAFPAQSHSIPTNIKLSPAVQASLQGTDCESGKKFFAGKINVTHAEIADRREPEVCEYAQGQPIKGWVCPKGQNWSIRADHPEYDAKMSAWSEEQESFVRSGIAHVQLTYREWPRCKYGGTIVVGWNRDDMIEKANIELRCVRCSGESSEGEVDT